LKALLLKNGVAFLHLNHSVEVKRCEFHLISNQGEYFARPRNRIVPQRLFTIGTSGFVFFPDATNGPQRNWALLDLPSSYFFD
jgi:hypothetical protein